MKDVAHPPTLGVLLAGGLARRMGGGDKPMRAIGGRTLLDRAIDRLAPQCDGLILNANGDLERFAATGLPVVADTVEGFAGPLAGILAALDWARENRPGIGWVVSIPTDSPFLPADLVVGLHAARHAAGTPLACARSGDQTHPVVGLWPVALAAELRHALVVEDIRKIDRWTARHGIAEAVWPLEPFDPFFNANRPEDLGEAEAILAQYPGA
ncbi:MAG: molybdenum cofactor guanylyltransferase MobA [Phreatobacter sp.]|uniref:molybdenum cofactor guanylyltransferase MobA n=1 Tax=Phreatobacter sp. TaxID=1966341 RepID=UPI001A3A1865|nr:molybdenum cofactor guanylyltransferase MobA [Phreatobacter sp.]MBL8569459.1 molybdenum cofactor guanylyltransferase MobA [Phreatobacter sp.]